VPITGAAQSPLASIPVGLMLILAGGILVGAEAGWGIRRLLRPRRGL
jgi:hypothetical protein